MLHIISHLPNASIFLSSLAASITLIKTQTLEVEIIICCCYFQTRSLFVIQAVFELTMSPRLTLNLQQSSCISLPNAEIIGIYHHAQLQNILSIGLYSKGNLNMWIAKLEKLMTRWVFTLENGFTPSTYLYCYFSTASLFQCFNFSLKLHQPPFLSCNREYIFEMRHKYLKFISPYPSYGM